MDRHGRQARLAEVGEDGQARVGRAHVDVSVGGFSGEVAARYLAGAGIGSLRVPTAAVAAAARAVDSNVTVEIAPAYEAVGARESDEAAMFGLRHDEACEIARGARIALRALRAVLEVSS